MVFLMTALLLLLRLGGTAYLIVLILVFGRWKASLIATRVVVLVLLVVTRFRKMPKALLIRNGTLRNLAYTFVTSFPTDLPS